MKTLWYRN